MQGYNCIMVYNQDKSKLLFCKRTKDPYKGLYNLVGGKIEDRTDGFGEAYRELFEETGIRKEDILLYYMMDFTYYNQDCYVEVYAGALKQEISLKEEIHPLCWLPVTDDFFDLKRFAGEGNIGHMVEQVNEYGMGQGKEIINIRNFRISHEHNEKEVCQKTADSNTNKDNIQRKQTNETGMLPASSKYTEDNSICIGVDGCKGGWIGAVLQHGELKLGRYTKIQDILKAHSDFNEFLIDMVIGLPGNSEHIRPEIAARKIIKERTSTIFPAPSRQAVYAETLAKAYDENKRVLGKKFTPLTVGIIPKIREVDSFLQKHHIYKNVIKESHPEVCFARLNGSTLLTKKSETEGIEERTAILQQYIPTLQTEYIVQAAKEYNCNEDDIIDAICLAVAANLVCHGNYEIIPGKPMRDDTGLLMRMVIPKV